MVLDRCSPVVPPGTDAWLAQLLGRCFAHNPKERPSAAELLAELRPKGYLMIFILVFIFSMLLGVPVVLFARQHRTYLDEIITRHYWWIVVCSWIVMLCVIKSTVSDLPLS